MCLLPIHDLPRLIFLDARDVTNLLFLEWAITTPCNLTGPAERFQSVRL